MTAPVETQRASPARYAAILGTTDPYQYVAHDLDTAPFQNYPGQNGKLTAMRAFNFKATIVIVFALSAAIAFMHTLVYFSIDPHGLSAQMPSGDLKRYNADRGTLLVGNRY